MQRRKARKRGLLVGRFRGGSPSRPLRHATSRACFGERKTPEFDFRPRWSKTCRERKPCTGNLAGRIRSSRGSSISRVSRRGRGGIALVFPGDGNSPRLFRIAAPSSTRPLCRACRGTHSIRAGMDWPPKRDARRRSAPARGQSRTMPGPRKPSRSTTRAARDEQSTRRSEMRNP